MIILFTIITGYSIGLITAYLLEIKDVKKQIGVN